MIRWIKMPRCQFFQYSERRDFQIMSQEMSNIFLNQYSDNASNEVILLSFIKCTDGVKYWCDDHGLSDNQNKKEFMLFTRNNKLSDLIKLSRFYGKRGRRKSLSLWKIVYCVTRTCGTLFGARTEYIVPHPKMAKLHSTHDIFCKIRPKEVFRVSVERYWGCRFTTRWTANILYEYQ